MHSIHELMWSLRSNRLKWCSRQHKCCTQIELPWNRGERKKDFSNFPMNWLSVVVFLHRLSLLMWAQYLQPHHELRQNRLVSNVAALPFLRKRFSHDCDPNYESVMPSVILRIADAFAHWSSIIDRMIFSTRVGSGERTKNSFHLWNITID